MALHVLDTDTLSLYERGDKTIQARWGAVDPAERAITILTFEEQIQGRLAVLRAARHAGQVAAAYEWLHRTALLLKEMQVLPFTPAAILRYEHLKSLRLNVGKMDLKIASVALEHGAVLVTRNRRDFARIPGLRVDDWSAPGDDAPQTP